MQNNKKTLQNNTKQCNKIHKKNKTKQNKSSAEKHATKVCYVHPLPHWKRFFIASWHSQWYKSNLVPHTNDTSDKHQSKWRTGWENSRKHQRIKKLTAHVTCRVRGCDLNQSSCKRPLAIHTAARSKSKMHGYRAHKPCSKSSERKELTLRLAVDLRTATASTANAGSQGRAWLPTPAQVYCRVWHVKYVNPPQSTIERCARIFCKPVVFERRN